MDRATPLRSIPAGRSDLTRPSPGPDRRRPDVPSRPAGLARAGGGSSRPARLDTAGGRPARSGQLVLPVSRRGGSLRPAPLRDPPRRPASTLAGWLSSGSGGWGSSDPNLPGLPAAGCRLAPGPAGLRLPHGSAQRRATPHTSAPPAVTPARPTGSVPDRTLPSAVPSERLRPGLAPLPPSLRPTCPHLRLPGTMPQPLTEASWLDPAGQPGGPSAGRTDLPVRPFSTGLSTDLPSWSVRPWPGGGCAPSSSAGHPPRRRLGRPGSGRTSGGGRRLSPSGRHPAGRSTRAGCRSRSEPGWGPAASWASEMPSQGDSFGLRRHLRNDLPHCRPANGLEPWAGAPLPARFLPAAIRTSARTLLRTWLHHRSYEGRTNRRDEADRSWPATDPAGRLLRSPLLGRTEAGWVAPALPISHRRGRWVGSSRHLRGAERRVGYPGSLGQGLPSADGALTGLGASFWREREGLLSPTE